MRRTIITVVLVIFTMMLFSEEKSEKKGLKEIKPYAEISNESEVSISGSDVKEDNFFNGYDNKTSGMGGISFVFNDVVALNLFLGASDFNWAIDNVGNFSYVTNEFYAGAGVDLTFSVASLSFYLSNMEIIDSGARVKSGLDFGASLSLTFEKAYLDISLSNNFKPSFNRYTANIYNSTGYELKFNFFNFINDKINTGLLVSGEYEGTAVVEKIIAQTYSYSNEFYAGIVTSPIEMLSAYLLFAMFNDGSIENKALVEGSKINSYGLKAGLSITVDKFSIEGYYLPKIGVFVDDKKEVSEHLIGLTLSISF